jgi:cytochrome b
MILQGDEAQVEARFNHFGDFTNLDARQVHDLRQTYHRLRIHFGHTQWNSFLTWAIWNLVSVRLEIVLVSVQERCTVRAKRTIGT